MTSILPISDNGSARTFHQALRDAGTAVKVERGIMLCHEGSRSSAVLLLSSGLALAHKQTAKGTQQNVAIFLPGDIVDHESFTLGISRCGAVALTSATYHKIAHSKLRVLLESDPGNAAAFLHYVAFQGALAQDWLLNIGRRPAFARIAHLLCEIVYRTNADLAETDSFPMPLTQADLAQSLGLSVVHVNRTLKRLRQGRLLQLRGGRIEILDWPRLKAAAGFRPGYLSLGT